MSIFGNLFRNAVKYVTVISPTSLYNPLDQNEDFDYNSDIISTILTCEKILAETLSKLPLEIYKTNDQEGKIKYIDHNLYRKLHNYPSSFLTSTTFFSTLERHRNHYGNAFAKINRNANGTVDNLEILQPEYFQGYHLENGKLFFYFSGIEMKEDLTINNDDVLHFKFLSHDGILGLNPLLSLDKELQNIWQGRQALNHQYKNNLSSERFIETTQNTNSKSGKDSIDELKKAYSGSVNNGKVPVLPTGFTIKSLPSVSIQDSRILESMNYSKKDIAALFGIPTDMLNIEQGSYSSVEANSINFRSNTFQYIAKVYKQELERKLLTEKELLEGVSIEFNINALIETDTNTRINYYKNLFQMGAISQNTINKLEGFETIKNGDYTWLQSQNIPVQEYDTFAKVMQGQDIKTKTELDDEEIIS